MSLEEEIFEKVFQQVYPDLIVTIMSEIADEVSDEDTMYIPDDILRDILNTSFEVVNAAAVADDVQQRIPDPEKRNDYVGDIERFIQEQGEIQEEMLENQREVEKYINEKRNINTIRATRTVSYYK